MGNKQTSSKPDYEGFAKELLGVKRPDIDGYDVEASAIKFNLLIVEDRVVPCGDNCACSWEYEIGETSKCLVENYASERKN